MAGPITVEGKDGQQFQFPEGTSPDVMKQALRKHYGQPAQAQPNEVRQPAMVDDPLGNGPAVGNSRGEPTEADWSAAARAAPRRQQEPMTYLESLGNPLDTATAMLSGANNMLYLGFDDEIAEGAAKLGATPMQGYSANQDQMRADQPGAFNGGGMVAGFAPFGIANAIAKPQGVLQTATMGASVGGVQGGAYGFGDTDGTLEQRLQGGMDGAKFGAGLGAAFGGGLAAAPKIVGAARSRGDGRSQLGNLLEGTIEPGSVSAEGIKALDRFLIDNQIRLNDDTVRRLQNVRNQFLEGGASAGSLPMRFKDILIEGLDGGNGQFRQALETHLRGTAVIGGKGGQTVMGAVDADLPAAKTALGQSFDSTLGDQSRLGALDDIQEKLRQIGREGYEPLLQAGPVSQEGADALNAVLNGPGMSKLYQPLETIAAGEGVDLAKMLKERPVEAAHWMQSKARQLSERSSDNVTSSAFTALRKRLLTGLDEATGGQYNAVRKQYGDEFGNQEALEFGDRFLTKASKDLDVDMMAREFEGLSERQKEVALLSVRDAIKSATGRGGQGSGPRLTRVREEQVTDALRRVFGDAGDTVASAIGKVDDFVGSRKRIDPRNGSPTASNQEAAKAARGNVQPGWRRKVGGALESVASDSAMSSAFGAPAPLSTVRNVLGSIGKGISGDPSKGLNALAELLEAPVQPRGQGSSLPPESAPPTPTPRNALADVPQSLVEGGPAPNPYTLDQVLADAPERPAGNPYVGRKSFRAEGRNALPEQLLREAIESGQLPPDATLDDLAALMAQR